MKAVPNINLEVKKKITPKDKLFSTIFNIDIMKNKAQNQKKKENMIILLYFMK